MNKKQVKIPGISCGHCVRTIESEIGALDNVLAVQADENSKMMEVTWNDPQIWENIRALLIEIDYPPED